MTARPFTGFGHETALFGVVEAVPRYDAGFGSPTEAFGWADAVEYDPGYGTPVAVMALVTDASVYPDDGGWAVELRAAWPVRGPYRVRLVDAAGTYHPTDGPGCYSGLPGQGANCRTNAARDALRFALPRLPLGVYALEVRWGENFSEVATAEAALRIVRANHAEDTYAMRRGLP